ncbi:thioredoxin-like protein [Athelia psychrophila]|uniref:glutathione transferase n=1 Tax=Athelia psychrophila TaxID=1759441 RepID=A0A167TIU6_9AGAM|nr:thioredoxin-like protein [Fibularhizoctonia sp. CBS 109695]
MVLKLYGSPISTCTKRVAVVLKEKNVPFEFIAIDFRKGEHKAPDFVAKQPFGQVPFIDDDGFILYESRAIGRYIATKYASQGPALIPLGDLKANALFEQAASSEQANFDAVAHVLSYEKWFKKCVAPHEI